VNVSSNPDSGVRRFHTADAGAPRLVCFPHAGGSASFFFPVSRALAPSVEVLAMQYPGRQDRHQEPLIDSITALADRVFAELRDVLDAPVTFFGHSMGATVAFEVARRMSGAGLAPPVRLIVSARRAPSLPTTERVHLRDDEGVLAQLRKLSGTAPEALGNEEIMRMAMPSIRNDYKAIETYVSEPDARVDCPVTAFAGDADPSGSVDEVRAWERHTTRDAELEVFSGGHFYLAERPQEVLDAITRRMTEDARRGAHEVP